MDIGIMGVTDLRGHLDIVALKYIRIEYLSGHSIRN